MPEESKIFSSSRVLSIDALRGFDMFWIIGGSTLFSLVLSIRENTWTSRLSLEFVHSSWHGMTFYDLIFPLFLFIVGLAIPFSLAKYINNKKEYKSAYSRIIRRVAILLVLGLLVNGLLDFNFPDMRWPGVLQRIAICYFFASIVELHSSKKYKPVIIGSTIAAILLIYWLVMRFIPVPGFGPGGFGPQDNLAGYIDRLLIPGRFCCYQFGDNEGIMSTLPAIATTLTGVLTGNLLKADKPWIFKLKWILIGGACSFALGWIWNFIFPINKILWTSSYVLFSSGLSLLLFGLFYWIIDCRGHKKWAFFFIVIGMNAITIYVVQALFDFGIIVDIFLHGFIGRIEQPGREILWTLCIIAIKWLFLYFLYRKKIFLKV